MGLCYSHLCPQHLWQCLAHGRCQIPIQIKEWRFCPAEWGTLSSVGPHLNLGLDAQRSLSATLAPSNRLWVTKERLATLSSLWKTAARLRAGRSVPSTHISSLHPQHCCFVLRKLPLLHLCLTHGKRQQQVKQKDRGSADPHLLLGCDKAMAVFSSCGLSSSWTAFS